MTHREQDDRLLHTELHQFETGRGGSRLAHEGDVRDAVPKRTDLVVGEHDVGERPAGALCVGGQECGQETGTGGGPYRKGDPLLPGGSTRLAYTAEFEDFQLRRVVLGLRR